MDKYYVIVAGNGTTSRANLEALLQDHFYANGENAIVVLPYEDKPSQGQVFAAQLAKEKNKELIIYTKSGKFDNMPAATTVEENADALPKAFAGEKVSAFLLWDDEDTYSNNLLADLKGIPCFDLTDGLNALSSEDVKRVEAPTIPAKEKLEAPVEEPVIDDEDEDEDEEDDEEEDEDEDYQVMEDVYFGVQAIARVFAEALVEAMNTPKKPSEGPTE